MIFYHNYEKYMGIMNCVSNWVQEGEAEIGRFSFKGMPQRFGLKFAIMAEFKHFTPCKWCMYENTQILRFKLTAKYTVAMARTAILDFQGQILNGIFSAIFPYFFTRQVPSDKEWVYPQLQRCFFLISFSNYGNGLLIWLDRKKMCETWCVIGHHAHKLKKFGKWLFEVVGYTLNNIT